MIIRQLPQDQMILVCTGDDCRRRGCKKLCEAIKTELRAQGLKGKVRVQRTKCLGHCKHAPNVMAFPSCELYSHVKKSDAESIVAQLGTRLDLAMAGREHERSAV